MTGYYYLKRGLFEHPSFVSNKPYSPREAWIWLIEKANFADAQFRHKSAIHHIPRGSYAGSYRSLASHWHWSADRVIRELRVWQKQGMVEVETRHGFLQLILCNYSRYQTPWNADATPARQQHDADATQTSTNQITESKAKKETKTPPNPPVPDFIDPLLWGDFREMRVNIKAPMTPKAEQLIFSKIDRFRQQGQDPNAILEQSIRNNWKDVYTIKEENNGRTGTSTQKPRSSGKHSGFAEQDYHAGTDGFIVN